MSIPNTFDEAFSRVCDLVDIFSQNESRYRSPGYSEAQARLDFIDKFWIALGWDVNHEIQTNPYEQEVKVEKPGQRSARRKRPDYTFHHQNFHDIRFYVEAKKPHHDIDKADYYFQTIRYGWSAKVPFSVLMDFEQFRVLDCRFEPKVEIALRLAIMSFHYTEYKDKEKFASIYYLFSRESVQSGSLDKYSTDNSPQKIGIPMQVKLFRDSYRDVDEQFLRTLDDYRERLVFDFKDLNPHLDGAALTEISQRTIDRLVFTRFLEDKLIEENALIENFGTKGSAWNDFIAASRKLNAVYNGIIFRQHAILDSNDLKVSDAVFSSICRSFSDTHSSYDFNSVPIHILGSIYERFLGNTVVADATSVKIEQKESVRRAGGVFYTPEYIVRYLVAGTVGKLIDKKTPKQIAELRFADISCGSGSFLLGIYDYLLRYHTKYYNQAKNRKEAVRSGCLEREDGTLGLSLRQRKTILIDNIYGVDIDPQAVEVAQLSLFLRLLEDETTASARGYQMEIRETMLPSLDKNIVCGNSLVDWDFSQKDLFDSDFEVRLNPMSYSATFKDIMTGAGGGFDAIIGNPPYISVQSGFIDEDVYKYLKKKYHTMERISDYFGLFTEKAVDLLRADGVCGYIVPSTLMMNLSFTRLRRHLLEETSINDVVHLGDGVFSGAVVPTCTLITGKHKPNAKTKIEIAAGSNNPYSENIRKSSILQKDLLKNEHYIFNVESDPKLKKILDKIRIETEPLEDFLQVREGIKTGDDKRFLSDHPFPDNNYPLLKGRDVTKYRIDQKLYINYDRAALSRPQTAAQFEAAEKLLIRRVGDSLIAAYDDNQLFCVHTLYTAVFKDKEFSAAAGYSLKFFLALINSPLMNFYYRKTSIKKGSVFPEVRIYSLNSLPVKKLDFNKPKDKALHDEIQDNVTQLLATKIEQKGVLTDRNVDFLARKELTLTENINKRINELYNLTSEEISLINNI